MFSAASFVDIFIRSRGCDDPGRPTDGRCGRTFINVNGTNVACSRKGHNVVIVDAKTGTIMLGVSPKKCTIGAFTGPLKAETHDATNRCDTSPRQDAATNRLV